MNSCLWVGLAVSLCVLLAVQAGAAPTSDVHQEAVASKDDTAADVESPPAKPPAVTGGSPSFRVRRSKFGKYFGGGCSTCGYSRPVVVSGCGGGCCSGGCGGGGYSGSYSQSSSSSSSYSGGYGGKK